MRDGEVTWKGRSMAPSALQVESEVRKEKSDVSEREVTVAD